MCRWAEVRSSNAKKKQSMQITVIRRNDEKVEMCCERVSHRAASWVQSKLTATFVCEACLDRVCMFSLSSSGCQVSVCVIQTSRFAELMITDDRLE